MNWPCSTSSHAGRQQQCYSHSTTSTRARLSVCTFRRLAGPENTWVQMNLESFSLTCRNCKISMILGPRPLDWHPGRVLEALVDAEQRRCVLSCWRFSTENQAALQPVAEHYGAEAGEMGDGREYLVKTHPKMGSLPFQELQGQLRCKSVPLQTVGLRARYSKLTLSQPPMAYFL